MADELPPAIQAFIANLDGYIPRIDEAAMTAERFGRVNEAAAAQVDAAMTAVRTATTEAAAAVTGLADATKVQADASKAASAEATVEADILKTLAETDAMVADASKAVTDSMRVQVGAMKTASEAATVLGDKQMAAAEKSSLAADKSRAALGKLKTASEIGFLAVGAGAIYATDKAMKFQAEATKLYTAAGLTGQQFQSVQQDLLKLGNQFGYSGQQMAEAMYHGVSAGLKYRDALAMTAQAANLAVIHGAKLEDTTYGLSSVMKSYNLTAKDVVGTSAMLNSIVGQGDMRFTDFNESIKNWTPTAAAMGISIHSFGAALAYLTDRGNSAEVASTRLTMGLSMMTSGSKQANAMLHSLGLTADSVSLKNKDLAAIMNHAGLTTNKLAADLRKPDGIYIALKELRDALTKSGASAAEADQVMSKIFGGGRSDKAIMSLMQNLDGLKGKYDDIGKAVGKYGKVSAQASETPAQKFKVLEATLQNLAVTVGSAILPAVQALAGGLSKAFADKSFQTAMADFGKYLGEVLKAATPLIPVVAKLASQFFAALGPALPPIAKALVQVADALGKSLGKVLQQIAPDIPKIAKSMGDFLIAMIPLIPAVTKLLLAFEPLLPVVAQLVEVFASSGAIIFEVYAKAIELVAVILKGLVSVISWVVKEILRLWQWLYDELVGHSVIPDMMHGISHWFGWMVDGVKGILRWFDGLPGMFGRWLSGAVTAVTNGLSRMVGFVRGLPGRIVSALGNMGSLLYNAGRNVIQGLINGVTSMIGSLGNAMGNIASKIAGYLPHSPAKEGPLSGQGDPYVSGGQIATRLAHGIVEGTATIGAAMTKLVAPAGSSSQEKHLAALYNSATKKEGRYEREEQDWLAKEHRYEAIYQRHHSKRYLKAEQHAAAMVKHYAELAAQQEKAAADFWSQYQHLMHPPKPHLLPGRTTSRSEYASALAAQNSLEALRSGPLGAWGSTGFGAGANSSRVGGTVDQHITLNINLNGTLGSLSPQQTSQLVGAVRTGLADRGRVNTSNGASNPWAL